MPPPPPCKSPCPTRAEAHQLQDGGAEGEEPVQEPVRVALHMGQGPFEFNKVVTSAGARWQPMNGLQLLQEPRN